jgi:hypothetical protein
MEQAANDIVPAFYSGVSGGGPLRRTPFRVDREQSSDDARGEGSDLRGFLTETAS